MTILGKVVFNNERLENVNKHVRSFIYLTFGAAFFKQSTVVLVPDKVRAMLLLDASVGYIYLINLYTKLHKVWLDLSISFNEH